MDNAWTEETRSFYRTRGIGGEVGYGVSPAVLVVDMTRAFTDPGHPVGSDQSGAVAAISRLLVTARRQEVPVVYTSLAFFPNDSDGMAWRRKMPALDRLSMGDPLAMEVDERIAPHAADIVLNKRAPSAFFETGLVSLLVPARIDTLIVTGCATSGCVRATVVDAVSYGYRTIVPAECISDRAPGPHEANVFDMESKYADVVQLAKVENYINSLARRL